MRWSVKIGKIAGIDLHLHLTFLLLVGYFLYRGYAQSNQWSVALGSAGYILLLFAIVVLHELGHALAARRYGIKTKDITLLPIGGVARLERMPEDPKQELVVAIAGPAVNVALAILLMAVMFVGVGLGEVFKFDILTGDLLVRLFWTNIFLAGFNMLPAFPMDGGRVLRAFLAMRMNRVKATMIAASIGQFMAMLFGLAGLFWQFNPILILVALFVWLGAEAEAQQVRTMSVLRGVSVGKVMATEFRTVSSHERLGDVAKELVSGFQTEFPVLEDDRVIGFIGVQDVVKGLSELGDTANVVAFVHKDFITARPDEPLDAVMARWQAEEASVLAVVDLGGLVGIVTRANLGEHVVVQTALANQRRR